MSHEFVEHREEYTTYVDSLTDAFAFVMEYVEKVGPVAAIRIHPDEWIDDDDKVKIKFHVVVEGRTDEDAAHGRSIPSDEGRAD